MTEEECAELAWIERHIREIESGAIEYQRGFTDDREAATGPYLDKLRARRDELRALKC